MAAKGYPGTPEKGGAIDGLDEAEADGREGLPRRHRARRRAGWSRAAAGCSASPRSGATSPRRATGPIARSTGSTSRPASAAATSAGARSPAPAGAADGGDPRPRRDRQPTRTGLPNRYDESQDVVHFAPADPRGASRRHLHHRRIYRRRCAEAGRSGEATSAAAAGPPAPLHFIFHSAYCCSTVLARAVDIEGMSMGLKEPLILNDMVGWRRRGADPRRLGAMLDDVLTLLARPFAPGEAVVVKPSNVLNSLAPAMLGLRPQSNALLLYAPLPDFLRSMAQEGALGTALGARAVHRPAARRDGRSRPGRAALSRPHRSPGRGRELAGPA